MSKKGGKVKVWWSKHPRVPLGATREAAMLKEQTEGSYQEGGKKQPSLTSLCSFSSDGGAV